MEMVLSKYKEDYDRAVEERYSMLVDMGFGELPDLRESAERQVDNTIRALGESAYFSSERRSPLTPARGRGFDYGLKVEWS